jgi:HPr kinase/phosphorylase
MQGLPADGTAATLHATAVAFDDAAILLIGPSGSGKSTLALHLIGLGARLVADDLVALHRAGDSVRAACPNPDLAGVIEARGIGLMRAPATAAARIGLVALPGPAEPAPRLPPPGCVTLLGCVIPLVRAGRDPHVAVALMLHLRHGRHA